MRVLLKISLSSIAAGLVITQASCATLNRQTTPPPRLPQLRPEPTFVADGPGCADAREKARRSPKLKEIIPPAPRTVFVPASSTTPLNGATLIMTVKVDAGGRAIPTTGHVSRHDNGVLVPGYRDEVESALEGLTFRPAVLGGCAVEGVATLYYNTKR